MAYRRIETYKVHLTRERDKLLRDETPNIDFDEWMSCRSTAVRGGLRPEVVRDLPVSVYFVLNETVPKSFAVDDRWYVFMPAKHYVYALDLLRNEAPIAGWLDEEKGLFILGTDRDEPVGEGPGEEVP